MEVWNDASLKIEPLNENAPAVFKDVISKITNYWVSAGTALGLYRDKDFIKGDTDLDFAFIGYDGATAQLIKALEGYKLVRSIIHDNKPMQLAFMKDGVLVDFYFHYPNELDHVDYVNVSESGMQLMPRRIYDRLEFIETKYGKIPFPSPIEEYLTIRYGTNWKIPSNEKPHFRKL